MTQNAWVILVLGPVNGAALVQLFLKLLLQVGRCLQLPFAVNFLCAMVQEARGRERERERGEVVMGTREARNSKVWAVTSVRKSKETHKRQKKKILWYRIHNISEHNYVCASCKKKSYITTDTDLQD